MNPTVRSLDRHATKMGTPQRRANVSEEEGLRSRDEGVTTTTSSCDGETEGVGHRVGNRVGAAAGGGEGGDGPSRPTTFKSHGRGV